MITKILILSSVAVWLIFDIYALQMGQPTESMQIRDWLLEWSWFSITLGILIGHWGFPTKERKPWMRGDLLVPGIVILVFIAFDLLWHHFGGGFAWFRYPGVWIVAGVPIGKFFWSQSR